MNKLIMVGLCIFTAGCTNFNYKYKDLHQMGNHEIRQNPLMLDWNRSGGNKSDYRTNDELWTQHRET